MDYKKPKKGKFIAAFAFYFWIAFEFLYMASPFAVFFYGAYSPVLNFLNDIPALAWTTRFFLPHVVRETSFWLLNLQLIVGAILTLGGLAFFIVGAVRIYSAKLRKKGAVTGGLYKYIRHPQYSAFIISSLGMLILWPRYIVLIGFVSMLFVYYFLALSEEKECLNKFGDTYAEYMKKTGRFFPRRHPKTEAKQTPKKPVKIILAYLISLVVIVGAAYGAQICSIHSLYAFYDENSATIALNEMSRDKIEEVKTIALADAQVRSKVVIKEDAAYLNYVLPTTWFAAEVPMNGINGHNGHVSPGGYDRNQYKIIFTLAIPQGDKFDGGKDILMSLHKRTGLLEVWVDLEKKKVTQVYQMPKNVMYSGVPEAIY